MRMNVGVTERLARASASRPWRVVAVWLLAVLASTAVIVTLLGSALTTDNDPIDNPESSQARALIEQAFPAGRLSRVDEVVVVRSTTAPEQVARTVADRIRATGVVASVSEPRLSPDADAALLALVMDPAAGDPAETVTEVIAVVEASSGAGAEVTMTGDYTADHDFVTLSEEDLQTGELQFGLPAALVILLLVFGAVVAGAVPLILALVSIVVALALTALVGQAFTLSFFVVNMLSGMGLALGIDYSLFVLARYREERHRGLPKIDAIARAGATSSRAVTFSGGAFVLALLGMVIVPDLIFRSLGVGAILVGLVAVAAALTLLPAVLSLLGDRVDSLRIPLVRRGAVAESRFWTAVVSRVMHRLALWLAASVAILLAAALPVLGMERSTGGISTLPDRFMSKQGFDSYTAEFGGGETEPALIVARDATSGEVDRLGELLAADAVFGPLAVERGTGGVTLVTAPVLGDATSANAAAAIERLRNNYVPEAFGTDSRVLVGGDSAETVDYFAMVDTWLPIEFAFVLGLTFLLLTVAFRSIVIAAKAIALNLLSVGAAYGLLVLVFQHGIGADLLGLQQVEGIEGWVPLFLFAVLFGLSMDYQVFLLSRIRERFVETGDNNGAVAWGIGSTARLITGAALIIVAVFAGFARGDLVMFQQMGFGVAVALLIDATLIRSVVVPASMTLLGRWNWYLPGWLRWLPHISVEGPADRRPAQVLAG